jgi:hypothetical protein
MIGAKRNREEGTLSNSSSSVKNGRDKCSNSSHNKSRNKKKRVEICKSDRELFKLCRKGLPTDLLIHIIQFVFCPLVTIPCSTSKHYISSNIISKCYGRLRTDLYQRHFLLTNRFCLKFKSESNAITKENNACIIGTDTNHNIQKKKKRRRRTSNNRNNIQRNKKSNINNNINNNNNRKGCFLPELPTHTQILIIDVQKWNFSTREDKTLLKHLLQYEIPKKYGKMPHLKHVYFCDKGNPHFRCLFYLLNKIDDTVESIRAIPFYHNLLTKYFHAREHKNSFINRRIDNFNDDTYVNINSDNNNKNEGDNDSNWVNNRMNRNCITFIAFPRLTTYYGPQDVNNNHYDWSIDTCKNLTHLEMDIWNMSFISFLFHLPNLKHVILHCKDNIMMMNEESAMAEQMADNFIEYFELRGNCTNTYLLMKFPIRTLNIMDSCYCSLNNFKFLRSNKYISELKISFRDSVLMGNNKTNHCIVMKEALDSCPSLTRLYLNMKHAVTTDRLYETLAQCKHLGHLTISLFYLDQFTCLIQGSLFSSLTLRCYFHCSLDKIKKKCEDIILWNRRLKSIELIQCGPIHQNNSDYSISHCNAISRLSLWGNHCYYLEDLCISFSTDPQLIQERQRQQSM